MNSIHNFLPSRGLHSNSTSYSKRNDKNHRQCEHAAAKVDTSFHECVQWKWCSVHRQVGTHMCMCNSVWVGVSEVRMVHKEGGIWTGHWKKWKCCSRDGGGRWQRPAGILDLVVQSTLCVAAQSLFFMVSTPPVSASSWSFLLSAVSAPGAWTRRSLGTSSCSWSGLL